MGSKEYFYGKNIKVLKNKSLDDLGGSVESPELVDAVVEERGRFIPHIDYSKPENFAHYGLAESYYEDSIKRVYQTYPYDGSLKEKIEWENSSSFLDKYIFENEYPRRTGYAVFSPDGWGTRAASFRVTTNETFYGKPSTLEYITVKGGPNAADSIFTGSWAKDNNKANIWDLSENRESNLKIGGNDGNTVEFWLKKGQWLTTEDDVDRTQREVIVDVYTTSSMSSSRGYGRLRVELTGTITTNDPVFLVTYMSGTAGFETASIGQNMTKAAVADDAWHHYAISFINSGSNIVKTSLYVDGAHNHTITPDSGTIDYVSGALVATIGALNTAPSGTVTSTPNIYRGYGKLSGSIDEFRYWKVKRTPEEIGRYWFTQVGGGTNSDTANTHLGVYYKFNEGKVGVSATDSAVLDYSGRISNGVWTGYTSNARNTGSAMETYMSSSGKFKHGSITEFKDPIIYSAHADVNALLTSSIAKGKEYDYRNNSALYFSVPSWIIEEDETKDRNTLKKLLQIMGSYFDNLHMQIKNLPDLKNIIYESGSFKPLPFMESLLDSSGFVSPEIFTDSTVLEKLLSRGEQLQYSDKLEDVKNLIYRNIYNNLVDIYKMKGTEKSFRNLIRCFGVDDELVRLNMYTDGATYTLKDNYYSTDTIKRYADFNHTDRFEATVYQATQSSNANSLSYIPGTPMTDSAGIPVTFEAEAIFPKKHDVDSLIYQAYPYVSSSIFGMHSSSMDSDDYTWATVDLFNFQVYAIKNHYESKDCYFMLSGTTHDSVHSIFPTLTSSMFRGVYDNQKWNFAVRFKPSQYPMVPGISGTVDPPVEYDIDFYGVNMVLDYPQNEFHVSGTATLTKTNAELVHSGSNRMYVGAHRTNFTGSVVTRSDMKVSSLRAWYSNIDNEEVRAHGSDANNFGVDSPYRSTYLMQTGMFGTHVPKKDTLILNWNFETTDTSDANGGFVVEDASSGSSDTKMLTRYGWLSDTVGRQYPGYGRFFPASSAQSIDREYVYSAKKRLPEVASSQDMINILTDDDDVFTRDTEPNHFYFAVEKSMYNVISDEIIKVFSTIKDFNNLIGEPVNRYRQDYKDMGKLRSLFFEKIGNTPDLDRYVDFYKWVDNSLTVMLQELIPASANFSENLRTLVESHVLERNKYWNKFPTLEGKLSDPEAPLFGINELAYNWKYGHAPIGTSATLANAIDVTGVANDHTFTLTSPVVMGGNGVTYTFKFVHGLNEVNAGASGNVYYISRHSDAGGTNPLTTAQRATALASAINGVASEYAAFSDGNVTSVNSVDLKITADASAGDGTIDLTFDSVGITGNGHANVLAATNGFAGDLILEGAFAGGTGHAENTNCFWWKERAERSEHPLSSSDAGVNSDKESILEAYTKDAISGSTYALKRFPKPYKFSMDVVDTVYHGTNFYLNKKIDFYKPITRFKYLGDALKGYIEIPGSSVDLGDNSGCVDYSDLETKKKYAFKATVPELNTYTDMKAGIPFPFTIYSSSVSSGHMAPIPQGLGRAVEFSGIHADAYAGAKETPLQGPFTEKYVGGKQHRHVALNVSSSKETLDTALDRPEGWKLAIGYTGSSGYVQCVRLYGPEFAGNNSGGTARSNLHYPYAIYYRDEVAKRPLNIKNIRQQTGSTIIGNYTHDYELINTVGRKTNNRSLVKNEGYSPEASVSTHISGVLDYTMPDRTVSGSNKYVITERFSAPGGPETSAGFLDIESGEYSVYNALPFRNLIRAYGGKGTLYSRLTQHCGPSGFSSFDDHTGSWYADEDAGVYNNPYEVVSASYHKVNRNSVDRQEIVGIGQHDETPYALNFTPVLQDYLSVDDDSSLNFYKSGGDLPFTLSAWIKMDDATTFPIMMREYLSYAFYVDINDKLHFLLLDLNPNMSVIQTVSEDTLTGHEGSWIHVAATYDGSAGAQGYTGMKLYVNGKKIRSTGTHVANASHPDLGILTVSDYVRMGSLSVAESLYIGAMSSDFFIVASPDNTSLDAYADGAIDEVSIWNKELTAREVNEIYTDGYFTGPANLNIHSATLNLVSWWKMGDGSTDVTFAGYTLSTGGSIAIIDQKSSNHAVVNSLNATTTGEGSIQKIALIPSITRKYYITECKKQYDNWWVQHNIPRKDLGYSWITSSAEVSGCLDYSFLTASDMGLSLRIDGAKGDFGAVNTDNVATTNYGYLSFMPKEAQKAIDVYSAGQDAVPGEQISLPAGLAINDHSAHHNSDSSNLWIQTDFVGLNTTIYEPITSSNNMLGYGGDTSLLEFPNIHVVRTKLQNHLTGAAYHYAVGKKYIGDGSVEEIVGNCFLNAGAALVLNPLLHHRNGPYQWPSWKQIRGGDHPVMRHLKKRNAYSLASTIRTENSNVDTDIIYNYIEPVVTSKYKPMRHKMNVKVASSDGLAPSSEVVLRHTYANNLGTFTYNLNAGFTHPISGILGVETSLIHDKIAVIDNKTNPEFRLQYPEPELGTEVYSDLKKVYVSQNLDQSYNPIEYFGYMVYSEVVYPKESLTYSSKLRRRLNYTEVDSQLLPFEHRTFWAKASLDGTLYRDKFSDAIPFPYASISQYRTLASASAGIRPIGSVNSQGFEMGANENVNIGGNPESVWPLAPLGELKVDHRHTAMTKYSDTYVDYTASVNYSFGVPYVSAKGIQDWNWTAVSESNNTPWYDSYEDYSEELRLIGKEYSIIPEFRISDYMEYYNEKEFDMTALNNSAFSIYGSGHAANLSGEVGTSMLPAEVLNKQYIEKYGASALDLFETILEVNTGSAKHPTADFSDDFFKTYSHSDFLKYFEIIYNEHKASPKKFADGEQQDFGVSSVTMRCDAIKKLLPYNGFYPVTRTTQMASLFRKAMTGKSNFMPTTCYSASAVTSEGWEAMLQPFFSPGIMYNTIKSGIAVDWPLWMERSQATFYGQYGAITNSPAFRLPFEALYEPQYHFPQYTPDLDGNGDPIAGTSTQEVYMLYPNAFSGSSGAVFAGDNTKLGEPDIKVHFRNQKEQLFEKSVVDSNTGEVSTVTTLIPANGYTDVLYGLAMNNFLAMVPEFFLKKRGMTTFASSPQKEWGKKERFKENNTYHMDVVLYKTEKLVMAEGPFLDSSAYYRGCIYGPPTQWFDISAADHDYEAVADTFAGSNNIHHVADPAYAPFTPPYFYGVASATISYTHDSDYAPTLDYILEKATISYGNDYSYLVKNKSIYSFTEITQKLGDAGTTKIVWPHSNAAKITVANKDAMCVSASVNLMEKTRVKKIKYGLQTERSLSSFDSSGEEVFFTPIEAEDGGEAEDIWTISTKFECPVLDYNEPGVVNTTSFTDHTSPVGMWMNYCDIPNNRDGVYIELRESSDKVKVDRNTNKSLIKACGFRTKRGKNAEKVGAIADSTTISEAVVAIPFFDIGDAKKLIPINKGMFEKQKRNYLGPDKVAIKLAGSEGEESTIKETSITKLVDAMQKYVFPPSMDFVNNEAAFNNVGPFVMYVMEFNQVLDKQDLADIWQGLMPKPAKAATKDSAAFSHMIGHYEMMNTDTWFKYSSRMRWLVFKVKQRAKYDFYKTTLKNTDDTRFEFPFKVGEEELPYSYNWPYDFCSIVEMAKVQASPRITLGPKLIPEIGENLDKLRDMQEMGFSVDAIKQLNTLTYATMDQTPPDKFKKEVPQGEDPFQGPWITFGAPTGDED